MATDPVYNARIEAFEAGTITALVRTEVAKNLKFAYLFPKQSTDSKQITVTEELPSDIFESQIAGEKKMRNITKGASPRKLRFRLQAESGMKFTENRIELDIENRDLENAKFDLMGIQSRIARELAKDIDTDTLAAVKEYCGTIDDSQIHGAWTTNTIEEIVADIVRIRSKLRPLPYDVDTIAVGDEAQLQVATKGSVLPAKWEFPTNGFTVDNTIQLGGSNIYWGGQVIEDDELFAFSSANPGLEIFYLNYNNPRVKSVPSIGDYESYTPIINVMMYDNSDKEEDPITTLKYSYGVGFHPIEKGKRMLHMTDILA